MRRTHVLLVGSLAVALIAGASTLAMAAETAKSAPPGYLLAVTAGPVDPAHKIPSVDQGGAGEPDVDLPLATALLTHGTAYDITLQLQAGTSFSGTCSLSYAIKQTVSGKSTVIQSASIAQEACGGGGQDVNYVQSAPIPDSPGPATLVGTVTFGKKAVSLSVPISIS